MYACISVMVLTWLRVLYWLCSARKFYLSLSFPSLSHFSAFLCHSSSPSLLSSSLSLSYPLFFLPFCSLLHCTRHRVLCCSCVTHCGQAAWPHPWEAWETNVWCIAPSVSCSAVAVLRSTQHVKLLITLAESLGWSDVLATLRLPSSVNNVTYKQGWINRDSHVRYRWAQEAGRAGMK